MPPFLARAKRAAGLRSRAWVWVALLAVGFLGGVVAPVPVPGPSIQARRVMAHPPTSPDGSGGLLSIVAHPDDDLLFMNPTLQGDITAGARVTTVYLTAGDAGLPSGYWQKRERGLQAAYAHMAGVQDAWVEGTITSRRLRTLTLQGNPRVSLVFLRLPDGLVKGTGSPSTRFQSLKLLWTGAISRITALDDSATYTREQLVGTLSDVMHATRPARIGTLDFRGTYRDADHSDHHTAGYLTLEAAARYATPTLVTDEPPAWEPQAGFSLVAYQGYTSVARPPNLSHVEAASKREAYLVYARYDTSRQNPNFIPREYVVARRE